jgi:hypothetical protein
LLIAFGVLGVAFIVLEFWRGAALAHLHLGIHLICVTLGFYTKGFIYVLTYYLAE